MIRETIYPRTRSSHLKLLRERPAQSGDIEISPLAIDIIVKDAGHVDTYDRQVVEKWLPSLICDYYIAKRSLEGQPGEKKVDNTLKKLQRHLDGAHAILRNEDWIRAALIGLSRRQAAQDLQAHIPESCENYIQRSNEAVKRVLADVETLSRLKQVAAQLPCDCVLAAASAERSGRPNSSKPALQHLGWGIHIVWTQHLEREAKIGLKSSYVRFANSIYALVEEASGSFDTLRNRLEDASSGVAGLAVL